ncbi:hypothetical protein ACFE04_020869 [Oxalis oulophora]
MLTIFLLVIFQAFQEGPSLSIGVKFDPTDQDIIWHFLTKVGFGNLKPHPFIDKFIPTVENAGGICYAHPQNLPVVALQDQPQEGHRNVAMLGNNDDERDDMIKSSRGIMLMHFLIFALRNSKLPFGHQERTPFPIFVIPPLFFLFFKDNTAIFPEPYSYTNRGDNFLEKGGALQSYLEKLVDADIVSQYVKQCRIGQMPITSSDSNWEVYERVKSGPMNRR